MLREGENFEVGDAVLSAEREEELSGG